MGIAHPCREDSWHAPDGGYSADDPDAGWVRVDDETACAWLDGPIGDTDLGPSRAQQFWEEEERKRLEREQQQKVDELLHPELVAAELAANHQAADKLLADMRANGEWINPDFIATIYKPRARKLARLRQRIRRPRPQRRSVHTARPRARRVSRRPSGTRAGPGSDDPHPGEPPASPPRSRNPRGRQLRPTHGARA
jgi:hypothetical protein